MKVVEAEDGMSVIANTVYVIPPNATLTIKGRRLRVARPAPPREHRRPIDTFFFSLAEDQGENAVCVILAGTGSDGTLGLKSVKEHGGLTLAQAEHDHMAMSGMPHSAAATGLVDEVMAVEDMPAKLVAYKSHLLTVAPNKGEDGTRQDLAAYLATSGRMLHAKNGHDFSRYKENTLVRRVQRRMQILQIDKVPAYIALLEEKPDQLELLFREFLIGVTQFFRDPKAFETLERIAIPKLLENKGASDAIRIWVPGCSTGEEVYSIAILVKEVSERLGIAPRIQIFGTDIDDRAVAFARAGRYRKLSGVSTQRLARWFADDGDEHCLVKEIREVCVFSPHSVIKDPPFSKLDLISCRNLLIYMNPELQDRVLRSFHYALRPSGILFLGPSEGATRLSLAFVALDKKHRIFERLDSKVLLPELSPSADKRQPPRPAMSGIPGHDRIDRNARRALEPYSPVFVVANQNQDIVRFSGGELGHYLEPSSGAASLSLFGLLRKALRPAVRAAVTTMLATKQAVVHDDIPVTIDGRSRLITMIVSPIAGELFVVAFQDSRVAGVMGHAAGIGEHPDANTQALEHELRTARSQLQSTIDELETTGEEMKSAAEEYQSVNEELQSSNEELETAKEEMQSVNEELHTINAEMTAKNEMMTLLNSDLKNLLDSTDIATIFLHNDLRIKSFTSGMTGIFHLRDADRGRPVTDIVTLLDYTELQKDVRTVLQNLEVLQKEVRVEKEGGMTFIMRIHPYRTVDNVVDGVVITFVDISERKKAEEHTALLMGELDHRVKNILSIVSAVVKQTLRTNTSPEAFTASVEGRIAAISKAHGQLTRHGGYDGAMLRNLIATELLPYDRMGDNIELTGPDVELTPKACLAMAMAVHELCSNAVKYGALSTSSGRLVVQWSILETAAKRSLNLVWTETGGPPVAEPSRRGFGTTLIERSLAHVFDASVKREFLAVGLQCSIEIPMTAEVGQARLSEEGKGAS